MRIVSRATLKEFWEQSSYSDSEQPLKAWYEEAKKADWTSPQDIKDKYRNASFVGNNRVVFNIKGNDYRLVVAVMYRAGALFIKFVGTHKEYDQINVETVEHKP